MSVDLVHDSVSGNSVVDHVGAGSPALVNGSRQPVFDHGTRDVVGLHAHRQEVLAFVG
jgi:hypothetical protein